MDLWPVPAWPSRNRSGGPSLEAPAGSGVDRRSPPRLRPPWRRSSLRAGPHCFWIFALPPGLGCRRGDRFRRSGMPGTTRILAEIRRSGASCRRGKTRRSRVRCPIQPSRFRWIRVARSPETWREPSREKRTRAVTWRSSPPRRGEAGSLATARVPAGARRCRKL